MSPMIEEQTERLVRFSRRQLWFVLVFLLLLGGATLVDLLFPVHLPRLALMPVCLAIGLAIYIGIPLKTEGIDFSSGSPAMQALRNDELRQFAQAKAFRNGFFILLAYPPLCAFALTGLGVHEPLAVVVDSGAWLGAVVFLASLLWHDR